MNVADILEQLSQGLRDTSGVELKNGDKVLISSPSNTPPVTTTRTEVELDDEMYGCLITLGIAEIHNERINCGYPAHGWIVHKIKESEENENEKV